MPSEWVFQGIWCQIVFKIQWGKAFNLFQILRKPRDGSDFYALNKFYPKSMIFYMQNSEMLSYKFYCLQVLIFYTAVISMFLIWCLLNWHSIVL